MAGALFDDDDYPFPVEKEIKEIEDKLNGENTPILNVPGEQLKDRIMEAKKNSTPIKVADGNENSEKVNDEENDNNKEFVEQLNAADEGIVEDDKEEDNSETSEKTNKINFDEKDSVFEDDVDEDKIFEKQLEGQVNENDEISEDVEKKIPESQKPVTASIKEDRLVTEVFYDKSHAVQDKAEIEDESDSDNVYEPRQAEPDEDEKDAVNENVDNDDENDEDSNNDSNNPMDEYERYREQKEKYGDIITPEDSRLSFRDVSAISYDDLNNGNNNDNEEFDEINGFDEKNIVRDKKDFKDLNETKNKSGKFKKNILFFFIIIFVFVVMVYLNLVTFKKERDAKKAVATEDNVNIKDYKPDFGDYKARMYKGESENVSQVDEENAVEALLDMDNKIDEAAKTTDRTPDKSLKKAEEYTPVQSAPASSSSSEPTEFDKANDSPLRYESKDFVTFRGSSNYYDDYSSSYSDSSSYTDYLDDARNTYLDNVNSIASSLSSSKGTSVSDSNQKNNDGKYNRSASGGSVTDIPDNSLYPGTIIHAVMVNGINTDNPGNITARVINPVYDSKTGKNLLIPAGSILRGSYSSASIGKSRIEIAWQTLIMNRDGKDYLVNLGSMAGVDKSGYSGIKGSLNEHAFAYLKACGISVLFTAINSNIYSISNAQKSKTVQEMISSGQEVENELADKILDRALDIEPTVVVKPGTRISVDVDKVLTLPVFERDEVKGKYVRR